MKSWNANDLKEKKRKEKTKMFSDFYGLSNGARKERRKKKFDRISKIFPLENRRVLVTGII